MDKMTENIYILPNWYFTFYMQYYISEASCLQVMETDSSLSRKKHIEGCLMTYTVDVDTE